MKVAPLVAATALLAIASPALAIEVTAGGAVHPLGFIGGAGIELGVGDNSAVEVRGSFMAYQYEATDYEEEGSGPMGGLRARWYPQDTGNATRLWLAAGLSGASVDYEWKEYSDGAVVDSKEDTAVVVLVEAGIGYKILFGDERFVLDPQILLGYFVSPDTEIDVLAGAGLSLGVRF